MYPVSQAFLDAVSALERRVVAKVVVDYTDPFLDQSIQIAVSEEANVSYPAQVADAVTEPAHKWASLDGSCVLDGSYRLAPDTDEDAGRYQMGWWGSQLAGAGGAFSAPYPALTVTHMPRPIHTLRAAGDSMRGEYPVDFQVELFAEDDTLLHAETVTDNTDTTWSKTLASPVLGVAKQVLTITRWSHEGRQVKVLEFFTSIQEVYLADDLTRLHLLEEREASQGSLPVGNISANEILIGIGNESHKFDPDNDQSPLYGLLKPRRRIRAWLGVGDPPEWVPLGTFWSLDWDAPDDTPEATVTARDRLDLLRKETFQTSQVQQDVSLCALAEQVLQDAGLTSSEYSIDTALQSIVIPYAWFEPVSHREALRLIAEAALAAVYADRDGKIRLEVGETTVTMVEGQAFIQGALFAADGEHPEVFGIGPDDYFAPLRAPSRQEQVANEIVVDTQPLRPAVAAEEVYRSNSPITVPANGTKAVTAHYNVTPVIDAAASLDNPPAGVSVISASCYGWGAQVTIENTNATDQDVTLFIDGKPLTIQNKERSTARDETSIAENGALRYEFPPNPLVQTLARAQTIADALLASYKDPRRDLEMNWRGNPALELGDAISVLTDAAKDRRSTYAVIRQEIDWTGALSARLTGRRLE